MDFLKNGRQKEEIGLSLLGSISAFSIHSAVNPSFFTIKAFATENHEENIRFGMNVGLILNGILSGGILLAYGKKGMIPALITGATGVGLYIAYDQMLKETIRDGPAAKIL